MDGRKIVTIFLNDADRSSQLARALEVERFQPILPENSDTFHQLLSRQRTDLVVIDQSLPGFLTGLEILGRLYDDLIRPVTILIGQLSPEEQKAARRLGVDAVLPEEAGCDQVRLAALHAFAAGNRLAFQLPPEARRLVQVTEVEPLPQLLVRMCQYLEDEESVSLLTLANEILTDARVTAQILKLANSSAMGRVCKTTNVYEAVKYLGLRRTLALAISDGMFRYGKSLSTSVSGGMNFWYLNRSVLIAGTAAAFAGELERISAETAYVLGLLQDIGMIVMARTFREDYTRLLDRTNRIGHLRLENIERNNFQMTHAEVSAALLLKWQLPTSLVRMVLHHHDSAQVAERSSIEEGFSRVMGVGESVANLLDNRSPQRFIEFNRRLEFYGRGQQRLLHTAIREGVNRAVDSSRLFNIPVPDEQQIADLISHMTEMVANCGESLPVAAPAARPHPELAESDESHPLTLLLIDDDEANVQLVREVMTELNAHLLVAADEDTACRYASGADVVLCDVQYRGGIRMNMIRRLRLAGYRGPIAIGSYDQSRNTVTTCIKFGIEDYLVKPLTSEILLAKLTEYGFLPNPQLCSGSVGG